MRRALGTCYYPEQWAPERWPLDAGRMVELGLSWVRMGEFAWAEIEPEPEVFAWDWLDRAMEVLGSAGLSIVLGTPTATPPRWMLEKHPDMLAVGADGRTRGFGSRRHYCFSHPGYREEAVRIAGLMAARYGDHPHLGAWQIDNEYGCHDTTLSYSAAARVGFQRWLAAKYGAIGPLNAAWGNVFWSMTYRAFEEIGLPIATVTVPNPTHAMDFRRFAADEVTAFNAAQAAVLRAHSDRPISHNFMGRELSFDAHAVGADLEIATWDSYPLGFLEDRVAAAPDWKRRFARQGDPDFQAFHHDLYRGVAGGRWWVMEQQPGPVNWAPYNPAPLPGMVRLWTWEAFAHGAEVISYFRWRQAPFGQEQMHAGLRRPDDAPASAWEEVAAVAAEIAARPDVATGRAPVALVFDYASAWAWEVEPQGQDFSYFDLVYDVYRGLRRLGLSIDILPPDAEDLAAYPLVLAPGLWTLGEAFLRSIAAAKGQVILGPRAGAKTMDFQIPTTLPPGIPDLECRVAHVESLRPDMELPLAGGGAFRHWAETLEGTAEVVLQRADGGAAAMRSGALTYLGGWPDRTALDRILRATCAELGIEVVDLPDGVRLRDTGAERFLFNYGPEPAEALGHTLPPAGVAILAR
ncbi:MAG: beta-galactosidase [Pseudomonadota bacterium]